MNKRKDRRKPLSGGNERLMHEMKAVQKVIEDLMAIDKREGKVKLKLGRMKADPVTFRAMFSDLAMSMGFQDVDLDIESVPVIAECKSCGFRGGVPVVEHVHFIRCPDCKKVADVLKGDELEIVE